MHVDRPLGLLFLQLMAIVGVSRALAFATVRLGQPLVIAEIVAGIVLGPSVLGALSPAGFAALFPAESLGALKLLSQLGLVLFMFLVGLELRSEQLLGHRRSAVVISLVSIALPFALGTLLALQIYEAYAPAGVQLTPFLLFAGIAMSITAFPVLARILQEHGLLNTPLGAVAIACAATDDIIGWCLLAAVVAIARSEGAIDALYTVGATAAFLAAMIWIARPTFRWLAERVAPGESRLSDRLTPGTMAVTLFMLLGASWATERIGIHAVFGAFLLGAVFPHQGGLPRALTEKLGVVPGVLLLPLFFAYSGLRTDIGLLSTPADWALTALIIVLATAGKLGGGALAARLTGEGKSEALALGVLMNTRGLMELVVLNIGLDLGVISPRLFTMMVLMALVTTFATSPLLRWLRPASPPVADPFSTVLVQRK